MVLDRRMNDRSMGAAQAAAEEESMSTSSSPFVSGCGALVRRALPVLVFAALAATGSAQTTCATGAATLQTFSSGCFPANCVSNAPLSWGLAAPELLFVPKFDPALGTLLEVRVRTLFGSAGDFCVDNGQLGCGAVSATFGLIGFVQPASTNQPPVTGVPAVNGQYSIELLPLGFLLGASDGVNDCTTPTGLESNGDCIPGEDHAIRTWSTLHAEPEITVPSTGLSAWVAGAPGDAVAFESTAIGALSVSGGGILSTSYDANGRARVDVTYVYCPPLGTVYCDCAGISPCGNLGQGGTGCANSTGLGARLAASGTASLAAGDLVLSGSQLPPNRPGVFLSGAGSTPIGAAVVLGGGALCTTGQLTRLEVVFADASGDCASSIDLGAGSGGGAGLPGHFQLWYRDAPTAPCGGGSNLTNGLEIVWAP